MTTTDTRPTLGAALTLGSLLGLALGVPAGLALKLAGYPSDELRAWWTVLAVAGVAILLVAVALAPRRRAWSAGLVLGAAAAGALAPALVVLDLVAHSA